MSDLFKDLMTLCNESDTFFFSDQVLDGITYRIFNYRLSSYSEFLKPNALWCRGTMFRMDELPVLVCRPIQKFFNLNENPMTMGLDLSPENIDFIDIKADGSLISTFIHNGELRVKSKGSLNSIQVQAAMDFLNKNPSFAQELYYLTELGFTIDLEYCSPFNRIVLLYDGEYLTPLHGIKLDNGQFADIHSFLGEPPQPNCYDSFPNIRKFLVKRMNNVTKDLPSLIANCPGETDIEGYIVRLKSGEMFKVKTEWYLTQHRCIDTINSDKRLYEAILAEASDDIKSLFSTNTPVLNRIEAMEIYVANIYNLNVKVLEQHLTNNKHLDRKQFAILSQNTMNNLFSCAMEVYIGRTTAPASIKNHMIKYVDFYLKDFISPSAGVVTE